ncbi:hypothetical protein ABDI30_11890 [Paenibacillus cisolokensis]|uniref:OB-fold protein n=1 Tax=Paenibacillus cisolokensis TaxID=1658519 RepID=UPI003D2D642A
MEEQKKKKTWFKKWWVWLLIVVIIGAIGSMNQETDNAKQTVAQPVTDSKGQEQEVEEVIAVSAIDLWNDYDENEVAADAKYKGKQIEVSGVVKDIGKDILDSIYITLETDAVLGSVQVYFSDKEAEAVGSLKKGQKVTVVGNGDGKTLTNVAIKKAQIK